MSDFQKKKILHFLCGLVTLAIIIFTPVCIYCMMDTRGIGCLFFTIFFVDGVLISIRVLIVKKINEIEDKQIAEQRQREEEEIKEREKRREAAERKRLEEEEREKLRVLDDLIEKAERNLAQMNKIMK